MTGASDVRVAKGALLDARHVTLVGLSFQATGGEVRLFDSVIVGSPAPEITLWRDVKWQADRNRYDARFLRVDQQFYSAKTFAGYQRDTAQDLHSRYEKIEVRDGKPQGLPAGVGADAKRLP